MIPTEMEEESTETEEEMPGVVKIVPKSSPPPGSIYLVSPDVLRRLTGRDISNAAIYDTELLAIVLEYLDQRRDISPGYLQVNVKIDNNLAIILDVNPMTISVYTRAELIDLVTDIAKAILNLYTLSIAQRGSRIEQSKIREWPYLYPTAIQQMRTIVDKYTGSISPGLSRSNYKEVIPERLIPRNRPVNPRFAYANPNPRPTPGQYYRPTARERLELMSAIPPIPSEYVPKVYESTVISPPEYLPSSIPKLNQFMISKGLA